MKQSSSLKIKNDKLGSVDVKNKILKYLQNSRINLKIEHSAIVNENDLDVIKNNDYIICPRFCGTRSWIIFFRIDNYYYAVNCSKYIKKNKNDFIIHPINITVSEKFYNGTIMEGIFFRSNKKRFLIVDEIYLLAGENQLLKSKDDRLNNLTYYIKTLTRTNSDYFMYASQYYYTTKKSLKDLYEKTKSDQRIQGIIFYPKIYGGKIYSYTVTDLDLVDNVIKLSKFVLQKTASPDVYNILSINNGNKIDIAYIPDIETSKKCKQWFKFNKKNELIVKCIMDMDKNKWIPSELIEEHVSDASIEN